MGHSRPKQFILCQRTFPRTCRTVACSPSQDIMPELRRRDPVWKRWNFRHRINRYSYFSVGMTFSLLLAWEDREGSNVEPTKWI